MTFWKPWAVDWSSFQRPQCIGCAPSLVRGQLSSWGLSDKPLQLFTVAPEKFIIGFQPQARLFTRTRNFPGGAVVKNQPANAGDARDVSSILGLGRFSGVGNGNPLMESQRWTWLSTHTHEHRLHTALKLNTNYGKFIINVNKYMLRNKYVNMSEKLLFLNKSGGWYFIPWLEECSSHLLGCRIYILRSQGYRTTFHSSFNCPS